MSDKLTERYNQRYSKSLAAFGEQADEILTQYYHLISNASPVLDVGAGQGRNCLFLAEKGYGVEALEPSPVGLKQIVKAAEKESLPIHLTLGDLDSFEKKCDSYAAVLLCGIIQILKQEQVDKLLNDLKDWTATGSLIFITAFSVKEPSYEKHKTDDKELSPNCFEDESGFIRHYLEENEILRMFEGCEVIHHREYITDEHHHGDGDLHRHAKIEAIFKVL